MATQFAAGKQALADSQYSKAIDLFTIALKSSPTSPDYLIQRSTAYHRAHQYSEALQDAEAAVLAAQKRAKRELIIEAQFRRGAALNLLGRLADAEFVLELVKAMKAKDKVEGANEMSADRYKHEHKQAEVFLQKTKKALEKLPEGDPARFVTVKETPDSGESTNGTASSTTSTATAPPAAPAPPQQTPADKIRHEWYQNTTSVYFTLLAKGVPKDKAHVEITQRSLSISFPTTTGSSYDLTLEPLFAAVKPSECITRVLPTKVEIILAKATPGQKWAALESNEPVAEPTTTTTTTEPAIFAQPPSTTTAPAYPTSSKSGPKNWDKITSNGKDGKEDDDEVGGDEANAFFKKLFKGATPEVQRAMMKSYTESNGTALSTNWEEVSKGRVETVPPDGMEAKGWQG